MTGLSEVLYVSATLHYRSWPLAVLGSRWPDTLWGRSPKAKEDCVYYRVTPVVLAHFWRQLTAMEAAWETQSREIEVNEVKLQTFREKLSDGVADEIQGALHLQRMEAFLYQQTQKRDTATVQIQVALRRLDRAQRYVGLNYPAEAYLEALSNAAPLPESPPLCVGEGAMDETGYPLAWRQRDERLQRGKSRLVDASDDLVELTEEGV